MALDTINPYGRPLDEAVGFPPERPDMPAFLPTSRVIGNSTQQVYRALDEAGADPDGDIEAE